jgi:hypothetical protein
VEASCEPTGAFDLDLCRERLLKPGLLAHVLDGEAVEP